MDIARAFQRCRTVLESLDALHELHADRETTAAVVDGLPAAAQERWFQRRPCPDETQFQRSVFLVDWLEQERKAAVAVHLNNLAKTSKVATGPSGQKQDSKNDSAPSAALSTDMGLLSGTMLVQQGDNSSSKPETGDQVPGPKIPRGPVTTGEVADQVTAKRLATLTEKKLDNCPLCKTRHFFDRAWTKVSLPKTTKMVSTHLSSCPRFAALNSADREKTVVSQGACLQCTAWDHLMHKLPGGVTAPDPKCGFKVGSGDCGGKHGAWFHSTSGGTANTGSAVSNCGSMPPRQPCLYKVYSVAVPSSQGQREVGTVLVDPGSDTDYIRHDYARRLGLQGVPYSYFLKVVDSEYVLKKSARYEFDLVDKDGETHCVSVLGLETIMTLPDKPDLSPLLPLLDGVPVEVLDRPKGQVDILLGLCSSSLHAWTVREWGNLRLMESRFGCGWILRGSHELLKFPSTSLRPVWSAEDQAMLTAVDKPPEKYSVFHGSTGLAYDQGFSELNELGTTPAPVLRTLETDISLDSNLSLIQDGANSDFPNKELHDRNVVKLDVGPASDRLDVFSADATDVFSAEAPVIRDDGKLGGLRGDFPTGMWIDLASVPLSPPLLHEVKLPGLGADGSVQVGLRHEPKLSLPHEVKLCGLCLQESDLSTLCLHLASPLYSSKLQPESWSVLLFPLLLLPLLLQASRWELMELQMEICLYTPYSCKCGLKPELKCVS